MARAYTVATIALALDVDIKWVDNILSRFEVDGVLQSRQGVARHIFTQGALELWIIQKLTKVLHMPVDVAVPRAKELAASALIDIGGGLDLRLDTDYSLRQLQARLEYAVEAAPIPRRGRPPLKAKRGALIGAPFRFSGRPSPPRDRSCLDGVFESPLELAELLVAIELDE